ncbi:hypothetical protein [Acerihabitans sp.]|uniref:hypothetical protein n=1 Tax=Acerihabitans sp. TaxID=2811394 RepID=UPI002EDA965E
MFNLLGCFGIKTAVTPKSHAGNSHGTTKTEWRYENFSVSNSTDCPKQAVRRDVKKGPSRRYVPVAHTKVFMTVTSGRLGRPECLSAPARNGRGLNPVSSCGTAERYRRRLSLGSGPEEQIFLAVFQRLLNGPT